MANEGGTAFPVEHTERHNGETVRWSESGMTLRQWYAGQALAGLLAAETPDNCYNPRNLARAAFARADAMIAEGEQ